MLIIFFLSVSHRTLFTFTSIYYKFVWCSFTKKKKNCWKIILMLNIIIFTVHSLKVRAAHNCGHNLSSLWTTLYRFSFLWCCWWWCRCWLLVCWWFGQKFIMVWLILCLLFEQQVVRTKWFQVYLKFICLFVICWSIFFESF